jgi:DNA mismatch repair ATPase MutS
MGLIALYHSWKNDGADEVDTRTWSDLGFDDVFAAMDHTVSQPGRQMLYRQLRQGAADDATVAERRALAEQFRSDPALREEVQLVLDRLRHEAAGYIGPLLVGELPKQPRFTALFRFLAVATPVCLAATVVYPILIVPALALVIANAGIYLRLGEMLASHLSGFGRLNALIGVAQQLAALPEVAALPPTQRLREKRGLLKQVRRKLGWLAMDRTALPELTQALFGYLNMLFLYDVVVFLRSLELLRAHRAELVEVFEAVGSLDAALSVASYTSSVRQVVAASPTAERRIEFAAVYHPLIRDAVANDLGLSGHGALIAGPNMAGKTAFIRTVGINLILAQTLGFCLATRAVVPRCRVTSAIRREDRLSDGESYFFAEVKRLLEFTQIAGSGSLHVFLIDEIYRGTNTTERIAASAAVLRYLGTRDLVLATTHDMELQGILDGVYDLYHFADRIQGEQYGFDYRLNAGPVRSRNALKLLELSGYPPAIVNDARALAAVLMSQENAGRVRLPAAS